MNNGNTINAFPHDPFTVPAWLFNESESSNQNVPFRIEQIPPAQRTDNGELPVRRAYLRGCVCVKINCKRVAPNERERVENFASTINNSMVQPEPGCSTYSARHEFTGKNPIVVQVDVTGKPIAGGVSGQPARPSPDILNILEAEMCAFGRELCHALHGNSTAETMLIKK